MISLYEVETGVDVEAFEQQFVPLFTSEAEGPRLGVPSSEAIVERQGGGQGLSSRESPRCFTLPVTEIM